MSGIMPQDQYEAIMDSKYGQDLWVFWCFEVKQWIQLYTDEYTFSQLLVNLEKWDLGRKVLDRMDVSHPEPLIVLPWRLVLEMSGRAFDAETGLNKGGTWSLQYHDGALKVRNALDGESEEVGTDYEDWSSTDVNPEI